MISLLRKCFEALQSTHDHHHDDIKDSANGGTSRRFLPIGKARHVLASSFESLKPKVLMNMSLLILVCNYYRIKRQAKINPGLRYDVVCGMWQVYKSITCHHLI